MSISTSLVPDKFFFISSHFSLSLLKAFLLLEISISVSFLNSLIQYLTNKLSISEPPKWESPPVDNTLNSLFSIVNTVTSKVPPPKSKIQTFFFLFDLFSNP